jgi:CHAT domain-containing protein/Tfp pilus assembly protein PilF
MLAAPARAARPESPASAKARPTPDAATREAQDASAALSLVVEAERLRADWVEASLRGAAEKYARAEWLWRAAGDARGAASALAGAARTHFVLGEHRRALELYRRAAAESRLAGDGQREAEAICHAGRLHSLLGDNDAALEQLKPGVAYYSRPSVEQTPDFKRSYAEALSHLGEVYLSRGDLVKSSEHFERALGLFAEAGGGSAAEARARLFRGHIAATVGEVEGAARRYEHALALYRAAGDRSGEALSLVALGVNHSMRREDEQAVKLQRQALDIFRAIGDRQSEAIALNGVGQAYQNLHEFDLALDNYEQSLKLSRSDGNRELAATTIFEMAGVLRARGETRQALDHYDRCARLSREAKATRMEAFALNEMAATYASQGKRERALEQYRKLRGFYAAIGDARGQAITLNHMGDFFLSSGDARRALTQYRAALLLSRRGGDRGVEVSTLYNLARAARATGDTEEALSKVAESIGVVESLRTNIASPDFRSSYFAGVRRHYELQVDLLMEMEQRRRGGGYAASALAVSERARARSLLELLAEVGTDIRKGADPKVVERMRELERLLKAQAQLRVDGAAGDAEDESEIAELRAEYQALQAQIREQGPRQTALTQPKALGLTEIQAELGDDETILLEYMLGAEKSYLWVVTRDSLNSYELPPRDALEKVALDLYKSLVARQSLGEAEAGYRERVIEADRAFDEHASRLSRELIGPVADRLGNRRLLIVAEGVLQYVPFDALPLPAAQAVSEGGAADDDPARPPLASRHEVVSLPSVSTLAGIRRERQRERTADDVVAVLADPVVNRLDARLRGDDAREEVAVAAESSPRALRDFSGIKGGGGNGGDFMRLAHTSDEADAIVAAAPRGAGAAAKGFDASRETATGSLVAGARIVHFATHGLINSEHPEFSGILLSTVRPGGAGADGFLDLQDIYGLNLSADLVVLSACETGLGKDVKGEGLVGLTRGFMYAGSKSVVASLWKVDDRATSVLMGRFYEALLRERLPPAAALRSAKEAVRREKRWRAPYYWAGFVLQGEYRDRIEVRPARWPGAAVAAALSLILIAAASALYVSRGRATRSR